MRAIYLLVSFFIILSFAVHSLTPIQMKDLPIQGEVFTVEGRTAFLILPEHTELDKPLPWVWYAPTLEGLPKQERQQRGSLDPK